VAEFVHPYRTSPLGSTCGQNSLPIRQYTRHSTQRSPMSQKWCCRRPYYQGLVLSVPKKDEGSQLGQGPTWVLGEVICPCLETQFLCTDLLPSYFFCLISDTLLPPTPYFPKKSTSSVHQRYTHNDKTVHPRDRRVNPTQPPRGHGAAHPPAV